MTIEVIIDIKGRLLNIDLHANLGYSSHNIIKGEKV